MADPAGRVSGLPFFLSCARRGARLPRDPAMEKNGRRDLRGTRQVVGYYRPFPWPRIGASRTGRTGVERALRAYCRQAELELVGFLVETDGRTRRPMEDRAVGAEAMRWLRTGVASGLVVLRPEHVFSCASDALASLERWLDEGLAFHCVDFLDDGSALRVEGDLFGVSPQTLLRGLSGLQRRIDWEYTRQRILQRRARSSWAGRVPFGFRWVEGVLVEEPGRLQAIQQMKRAHHRGKTYREIARAHGISIGTAHRLVRTDLRKLRIERSPARPRQPAPLGDP